MALTLDDLKKMKCPCGCGYAEELKLAWCPRHRDKNIDVFFEQETETLRIVCGACSTKDEDGMILPFRVLYRIKIGPAKIVAAWAPPDVDACPPPQTTAG